MKSNQELIASTPARKPGIFSRAADLLAGFLIVIGGAFGLLIILGVLCRAVFAAWHFGWGLL